jgi:hypothetical protein
MTIKMKVLRVMADGKPRTAKEVTAETGLQPRQAEAAIRSLATRGMADSTPVMYQLNARGLERAKFTPKPQQQRNAERSVRRREARKSEPAPERCPLSMAWVNVASEAA